MYRQEREKEREGELESVESGFFAFPRLQFTASDNAAAEGGGMCDNNQHTRHAGHSLIEFLDPTVERKEGAETSEEKERKGKIRQTIWSLRMTWASFCARNEVESSNYRRTCARNFASVS